MILFCDTSALMKLFVQEQHSASMQAAFQSASRIAVSQLTWVEMCAALALKQRTQQIDAPQAAQALQELQQEWGGYSQLAVDSALITNAGDLAQTFGLRAYDSLQLASVLRIHSQAGATMAFCCFDKQLNTAAGALGIQLTTP
ncbi:MAG: type II toxin-antitoxin system VapC family toxin [Rhodoferax sp.]|nr:type II toxin-antitoxin system VapC family toxin [Rhodoferax sp.]